MPRPQEEGRRAEAPMLQAALAYATNGWQVFPAPRGKKKSHKSARYSNGQRWGATTDPDQIKRDWKKWPKANIGLPTGPETGFFVVEADTVEGHGVDGIANLRALEAEHGPLPPTRMARSPSGSLHHYFGYPTDGTAIRNSEGKLASGVDVRGDGGMVIAPPSVRPGEGEYRWLNDLPIADPPQWLIEAANQKKKAKKAKKAKPSGFEVHLARLGDGPGLGGFHGPLLGAVASYVATHGAAFDRAALKARLWQAIRAAPMAKPRDYLNDAYLDDLISSAIEKFGAGDDDIKRLNATHAVLPIGGNTRVVTFGEMDEFPGRTTIVMTQTLGDFVNLHDKYRHEYIDSEGVAKSVPLGKYWRSSRHRRQYDGGMAFMPRHDPGVVGDKLNLWRGFGVRPIKPEGMSGAAGCKQFLNFSNDVICSRNAEHYDYLLNREAFIVQQRARSEVALGMSSEEEGVGKGFFERHMGRLLGSHAMQVTHPKHIVGAFNPHLETLLRLTADEALFVGNHEHRNMLFGLITEQKLTIEPKGCGVYTASNYLNISITSNARHFIPVSGTARRFFVPIVSSEHMQDRSYFRSIEDELVNEGGDAALLYHLLYERNLRDFDVGVVPKTAALADQAAYSRRGIDGLVEQACNEGRVPCAHHSWPGFTVTSGEEEGIGFFHFVNHHKDRELARYGPVTVIRRLRVEWACTTGVQRRERAATGDRTRGFEWPSLSELRERFVNRFGPQEWSAPDITEWP